jgi:hypothetical protein
MGRAAFESGLVAERKDPDFQTGCGEIIGQEVPQPHPILRSRHPRSKRMSVDPSNGDDTI